MRRLLILSCVVLLTGCIKRAEPVMAPDPTLVAAVFLFDQEDVPEVLDAPESLTRAATSLLHGHNLVTEVVDWEDWATPFGTLRSTRQRLKHLLESTEAEVVLLVETRARFGSLMEGRYRWTVPVQLTLARRGAADFPVQATVEVPVFLRFAHEQGLEAVEAAGPTITRRLSRMADELLRDGVPVGARKQTPALTAPMGADAIYFVLVDRHRNGDPANDGDADTSDPQAFHGGDLRGVIDDLDRLAALGFRSVWLSPVWTTRDARIGEWGSFHGYWVEDPSAVEPRFGTEAELVELSAALRDRGMGLILDVVTNHVAPGSPLLAEHPDWFHHNGDIVDWHDPVQAVQNDVHGLPDLAQEQPVVRDWLIGSGERWIRRLKPEGFRLDAVRHVGLPFWTDYNAAMRAIGGEDLSLVGELFDGDPGAVAGAWTGGGFGGMFDFPLYYALLDVVCGGEPVGRLASVLAQDRRYPDPRRLVTFLDNHDLPRLASRCDADGVGDALTVLLSLRGRPAITWGTEAGLDGADEPENREDFPWAAARPWETQIAHGLALRAKHPALRSTDREVLALGADHLAFLQRAGGASVLAINKGATPWTLPLPPGVWRDPVRGAELGLSLEVPAGGTARALGTTSAERLPTRSTDLEFLLAAAPAGTVLLVGAGSELGNWDPAGGIVAVAGGSRLRAEAALPVGHVLEYKFVVRLPDGTIEWEDRPNRYLLVGPTPSSISVTWNA